MTDDESELDDLFHGCAFAAFVERAVAEGGWPDADTTRRLAYRYYEETLAELNRRQGIDSRGSEARAEPGGTAACHAPRRSRSEKPFDSEPCRQKNPPGAAGRVGSVSFENPTATAIHGRQRR